MKLFKNDLLLGRKILVTGASSGIGRSASIMLNAMGASLVIHGRDQLRTLEVYGNLRGDNNRYYVSDFENFNSSVEMFARIHNECGSFDGVFHCAGASLIKPVRLINESDFKSIFDSSVTSSLALAKVFSKKNALNDGASLIFMSSVSAKHGHIGMTLYSAAKSAITGLVKSLAVELSDKKIRVNSIVSGAVDTELHQKVLCRLPSSSIQDYEKSHLLGFGSVEDISNLVIFLMSDASRWITGSDLVIDGGYSTR